MPSRVPFFQNLVQICLGFLFKGSTRVVIFWDKKGGRTRHTRKDMVAETRSRAESRHAKGI